MFIFMFIRDFSLEMLSKSLVNKSEIKRQIRSKAIKYVILCLKATLSHGKGMKALRELLRILRIDPLSTSIFRVLRGERAASKENRTNVLRGRG